MNGAWKHNELRIRETNRIANHAAAKQAKHLNGVFRADDIGISDYEQGWRVVGFNVFRSPAHARQGRALLIETPRENPRFEARDDSGAPQGEFATQAQARYTQATLERAKTKSVHQQLTN